MGLSGAEAACSVHGSPAGWRAESVSTDFHVLRQGFIPPNPSRRMSSYEKRSYMEIGNALFGISRGEFPIEREEGFEEELFRLFDVIAPDSSDSWREYGMDFENGVFSVFPYYWGDCTCGFDEKDSQWSEENAHEPHCYQSALKQALDEWLKENPEPEAEMFNTSFEEVETGITLFTAVSARSPSADMWREWHDAKQKIEEKIYHRLCTEFDVDRDYGCAVHCTCDFKERRKQFHEENHHSENCPIIKPNFLYKPTGFAIKWYKYPLRDSYMNQNISLDEFKSIISKCIESYSPQP